MGAIYFQISEAQSLIFKQFDSDNGLASSEIFDINQDKYGQLWFGTNHGISSFNLKKFKNWGINEGLPNDLVVKILFDKTGKMWILTLSNGIYYFDQEKQNFKEATFNKGLRKIMHTRFISQIVFDDSNKIWFSIRYEEIYSIKNNKIKLEQTVNNLPHGFGFIVFNVSDNLRLFSNLISDDNKLQPLKLEYVNTKIIKLNYDKQIYILGPSGLKLSNGDELICYKNDIIRFKNNKILTRFNIGNSFIMRVYEDKNHNIWLCTQVGGLYKFTNGIIDKEHCQQFFLGQNITNVFFDKNESLWVGSVGQGVYRINNNEVIRYFPDIKVKDLSVINDKLFIGIEPGKVLEYENNDFKEKFVDEKIEIRKVIEYKNTPLILYSTFNDKTKNDKIFPAIVAKSGVVVGGKLYAVIYTLMEYSNDLKERKEIVFPSKTSCILKLNESSMLVGTQKGLYRYFTNGSFSPFIKNKILMQNKIETIVQDDINYYVSIRDKGFYFINKNTLKIDSIKNKLLENNLIFNVFIEGNNKIWLSTSSGCYQFIYSKPKSQFILTNEFSIKNGIIGGDVNKIIAHKEFYYVATSKGIYKIPLNFNFKKLKSNLFFEKVVSGNTIFLNRPSFKSTVFPMKTERTIEIEFANSSFLKTNPAYRYRIIKGKIASEWNNTNSELIQLLNLTNGTYKLEVSTYDGNSNTAVLNFTIPPVFKETIWYNLFLIFIIISAIVVIIYQVFRFQKTRRNLAESKLLAMQTKLNPHFVFNSLNSMQHLLFDKNFETSNKYLTAFSGLMRKCFEFADKDFITLNEEVNFIKTYLEIEQLNTLFEYKIIISNDLNQFNTQIPPLFLQPIIENCIKHGFKNPEGNYLLTVFIKLENKILNIEIENNGMINELIAYNKKEGSLAVLNKRIDHLKSIYKDNTFSITFSVINHKTKATIILPSKKSY